MAAFDLTVEARSARWDEAMLGSEAMAHSGKGVDFYGAVERGFEARRVPVGEDGVVVGLDDFDGERQGGQDILDEGFGDMDGHFFMELDDAESGAAIDSGVLIESTVLDEVGDEFDIDLE